MRTLLPGGRDGGRLCGAQPLDPDLRERELREREAGLRTHLLVSLGSALFTIVSAYGFHAFLASGQSVVRADPTRIAAQIVTGIGFLGAGAIIRQGLSIRGLTTAATLWVVAAVSCGIVGGTPLLDLDYSEDSTAEVDANVVMTGDGGLVEVQATAERTPLSRAHLDHLLQLAQKGIDGLRAAQEAALR